jgi:hypothetical protein
VGLPEIKEAVLSKNDGQLWVSKQAANSDFVTSYNPDGGFNSCLYRRQSKVTAWASHNLVGADIVSMAVLPGGSLIFGQSESEKLWFLVKRGNVMTLENADISGEIYLDASQSKLDAAKTAWEFRGNLNEIYGTRLKVYADGGILAPTAYTVSGSTLTLNSPASAVRIGALFTSKYRPFPFPLEMQDGTSAGRMQKTGPTKVQFERTQHCEYRDAVGRESWEIQFRDAGDDVSITPSFSGWKEINMENRIRHELAFELSTSSPWRLEILAIVPSVAVYGT